MKQLVYLCSGIFGFIGSYIPVLLGDSSFLSAWSILGALVGGIFGIFVGVKLSNV